MTAQAVFPVLVVRLDAGAKPWRVTREGDLYIEVINLPLARTGADRGVPLAFAAMPGCYIAALAEYAWPWRQRRTMLLLNPAWDVPASILPMLLSELAENVLDAPSDAGPASARILCDFSQQILGYVLPASCELTDTIRRGLRDLSGFDFSVDSALLQALGLGCQLHRVRIPSDVILSSAVASFPTLPALATHVAQARVRALAAGNRQTWAVMTHHAGDLFLALKAIEASPGCVQGIVVHAAYADIVREVLPDLPMLALDAPMPGRGEAWSRAHPFNDELLYFERYVLPALLPEMAIRFLRPIRGYIDAEFTFGAQLAFVLDGPTAMAHFPQGAMLSCDAGLSDAELQLPKIQGRRVLLHFDGGWPLKIYPPAQQQALIAGLQALHCSVSVLGPVESHQDGLRIHAFSGLANLRYLMETHDVLIGMDSFPCHYASLQLGMPTLCLFGPTSQPHLAHEARNYLALSRGLSCSPCNAYSVCPVYGGTVCRNFADPETVLRVFARCLENP